MSIRNCATVAVWCAALAGCAVIDNSGGANDLLRIQREAQAAFDSGEDARAETLFKALARAVPNDAETWLRLGNLYARTNNPEQAVDAYMKSLSLNSSDSRAWNNLGIVRLRQSWAALIRANSLSDPKDPAFATSSEIVKVLETLPSIADLKAAKPLVGAAGAGVGGKK
ncbi:MAG: tetratricopeptide repeat protein [Betaproteobacteria bacterium]|nr:tetratricopeptide repeat protein [Betaproteobacteria bacterium]